ncbi:MAG: arsenate reductase (glutaredoxin) [Pseudomonadota bacterium]
MKVTIYHNPRCGKSRETLALLREQGIEPVIVDYLNVPPDAAALKKLLAALQLKPRQLLRTKEKIYKSLGLDNPTLSDAGLIKAMVEHPLLIERPIVVAGGKAVLGRPPENVLDII